MINVLWGLSPTSAEPSPRAAIAAFGFVIGGVTMPGVCFLTAWRPGFRRLFFIPVAALIVAVVQVLRIGPK